MCSSLEILDLSKNLMKQQPEATAFYRPFTPLRAEKFGCQIEMEIPPESQLYCSFIYDTCNNKRKKREV